MFALSFDDEFEVKVRGEGGTYEDLATYYQRYVTDEPSGDPAFTCTVTSSTPAPDLALGDPNLYYGRADDQFVVEDTSSTAALSRDWTHVDCTPDTSKNTVAYLLEYEMRRQHVESGRALVHASGVTVEGSTLVFPAWRHTGKTNLMLSLLERYGGGYLSDDRFWIHEDGGVTGYDLPVNMMPYNVKAFSDLGTFSRTKRAAAKASNVARWFSHRYDGFLAKAASFTNIFYLEPAAAKLVTIDDLLPDAEFQRRGTADAVVLLQTAPNASEVELHEATESEVRRSFAASSHYEWNKELEEYCRVFESLFPDADRLSRHREFLAAEEAVFDSFLEEVRAFKLTIPREERWQEKDIGEQAVARVTEVLNRL